MDPRILDIIDREKLGEIDYYSLQTLGVSDRTLRIFACDYVSKYLHYFEEDFPGDKRPRKAIETARLFANGEATLADLMAAEAAADNAAVDAASNMFLPNTKTSVLVARAAACAADNATGWAAAERSSRQIIVSRWNEEITWKNHLLSLIEEQFHEVNYKTDRRAAIAATRAKKLARYDLYRQNQRQ